MKQNLTRMRRGLWLGLGLAATSAGCSIAPPQPWDKDLLARPAMSMSVDSLEHRSAQHIYGSRESASGGLGVGGGGCGCY